MASADRQLRAAENQSLYRMVNERIEDLKKGRGGPLPMSDWVCECADPECSVAIELTTAEYERVRSRPDTFAVAVGHVYADVEHVVEKTERYVVVQKIEAAAEFAMAHDPRREQNAEESDVSS